MAEPITPQTGRVVEHQGTRYWIASTLDEPPEVMLEFVVDLLDVDMADFQRRLMLQLLYGRPYPLPTTATPLLDGLMTA